MNDAVVQLVADDVAAGVDFHQAGLHEAIDVRVQTAQSGRELARKHVHGALREVHRGPAIAGLAIQRTALRHVVRHVRDVDTQPVVAVRQPIDGDRVVEVPGVLAVDRDRLDVPEIGPAGEVPVSHRRPEADRLRHGLLAVCLRNPVLAENHAEVHTGRLDVAEHLDDAAGRVARRRRKSRDLDRDHLTRLRPARIAGDHLDVHEQLAIEGHDIAQARPVEHVAPHHRRRVALEDLDDAALGTTAFPHTLQSRDDAVAVHRLPKVAAGDVDVPRHVVERALGSDEPIALRIHVDAADHEMHAVGKAHVAAAGLDEGAGPHEVLDPPSKRGPLVSRNFQPLHELRHRCGMIDPLADQGQNLVVRKHCWKSTAFGLRHRSSVFGLRSSVFRSSVFGLRSGLRTTGYWLRGLCRNSVRARSLQPVACSRDTALVFRLKTTFSNRRPNPVV